LLRRLTHSSQSRCGRHPQTAQRCSKVIANHSMLSAGWVLRCICASQLCVVCKMQFSLYKRKHSRGRALHCSVAGADFVAAARSKQTICRTFLPHCNASNL
jgi:hypothetical protein